MKTVKRGQRLSCKRCGYVWYARQTVIRICPTCKTKHFETPRTNNKGKHPKQAA